MLAEEPRECTVPPLYNIFPSPVAAHSELQHHLKNISHPCLMHASATHRSAVIMGGTLICDF